MRKSLPAVGFALLPPCRRHHALKLVYLSCAIGACASPTQLRAQTCFSRPTQDCKAFALVQFGLGMYLRPLTNPNPNLTASKAVVTVDAGYMVSVGAKSALGGGIFYGANDNDGWVGVQGRFRRWLTDRLSLDAALGVAGTGESLPSPMLLGEVGLNLDDRASVFLQLQPVGNREWFTRHNPGAHSNTYIAPSISARIGGPKAAMLGLGLTALVGLFWAVLS